MLTGAGFLVGLVAEVLQLHGEVGGTEDLAQAQERGAGVTVAAGVDEVADLPVPATGQADQPLGVVGERLKGDEGRPLSLGVGEVRGGDQPAQVGVALAILGEQYQVVRVTGRVGLVTSGTRRARGRAPGRGGAVWHRRPVWRRRGQQRLHPHLGAEDGFDAPLLAGLGEAHRSVEPVVIGEGQRRLPELGRAGDQFLHPAATVEEREVGVHVQVHEVVGAGARSRGAGEGRVRVGAAGSGWGAESGVGAASRRAGLGVGRRRRSGACAGSAASGPVCTVRSACSCRLSGRV